MAQRPHEGGPASQQPEAQSTDARTRSGRCGGASLPSTISAVAPASAGPVRIDVIGVCVEGGHAVLSLSREYSTPWLRGFNAVFLGDDFREHVPDGWVHKGKHRVSGLGYDLRDRVLQIRNVPSDEASFRQLMVAVRIALERTNATEPTEDPPIADSSLTPVLEEVFRIQGGTASGAT